MTSAAEQLLLKAHARGRQDKVLAPLNLGLYTDRMPLLLDDSALQEVWNMRYEDGRVGNFNMGWLPFLTTDQSEARALNGSVILIDNFIRTDGVQFLVFGTPTDFYRYDPTAQPGETVVYLTPRYATGTAAPGVYNAGQDETPVVGTGTSWDTAPGGLSGRNANVRVGDEIHFGSAAQTDPKKAWFVVKAVTDDLNLTVTGDASSEPSGIYTIRQRFEGESDDIWDTEVFLQAVIVTSPIHAISPRDMWYAANGFEVVRWDGSADQVERIDGQLGFTCRVLKKFKGRLCFGDLVEAGARRPQNMAYSPVGEPESRDIAKGAGSIAVLDSSAFLVELLPLGDYLVAYGEEREISLLANIDEPVVFLVRTAIPSISCLSSRSVTDWGDYHEFPGPDRHYRFDGVGIQEIHGHVLRDAVQGRSQERRVRILAYVDEERGESTWCIPETGDVTEAPRVAWVTNYFEQVGNKPKPITRRYLPAMSVGFYERQETLRFSDLPTGFNTVNFRWNDRFFESAFPQILFGTEEGYVYLLNSADAFDGVPIDSYCTTRRFALMDGEQKGFIKSLETMLRWREPSNQTLELRVHVYGASLPDEPMKLLRTLSVPTDMRTGLEYRRFAVNRIARYVELRIETVAIPGPFAPPTTVFALNGFKLRSSVAGDRG